MPAHQHWRVMFPSIGLGYVTIRELWMRDAGGVDLNTTVGGTPSASSYYSDGYLPAYAFDRNETTPWANVNNQFSAWLRFSFNSPVEVETVDIRHGSAGSELAGPPSIAYSDDGVSWSGYAEMPLLSGSIAINALSTHQVAYGLPPGVSIAKNFGIGLYVQAALTPAINVKDLGFQRPVRDYYHRGRGRVWGYVDKDASPNPAVPLRRKVVLIREQDNMAIAVTWSRSSDGFYEFLNVDHNITYYTVAFDHERNYRMVGADNLKPELMT